MTTKHSASDMRAAVVRHVAFEDLGSFEPVLESRGYAIDYYSAGSDDLGVIDAGVDMLIILGGPISANDLDEYPFLEDEIALLQQRIDANRATLGICLGAQLIARALGSKVYQGEHKEIGWSVLSLSEAGQDSPLKHVVDVPVLHWHGETFDIPAGASPLASTGYYPNQAFSLGNTLALQFHPEVTARGLEQWFIGHTREINQTEGISVSQLREDTRQHAPALASRAEALLSDWLDHLQA